MVDVPRGQLIRLHETMISGFRQMSDGLRIMADGVVADRPSPEVVADALREIADGIDRIVEDA